MTGPKRHYNLYNIHAIRRYGHNLMIGNASHARHFPQQQSFELEVECCVFPSNGRVF